MIDELRRALVEAGVRVRQERLLREVGYHAHSGICRVGEQRVLLLDPDLEPDHQIELLLEALDGHDLSKLDLSEQARPLIAPIARRRHPEPEP